MRQFKLMDLFCGGGGCAMGYHRAGFEVHGCDKEDQKHYPFGFVRMDWREYLDTYGHLFDAIHASPPCQVNSSLRNVQKNREAYDRKHEDLIAPVRDALIATGRPYVIENVQGAWRKMRNPIMLCGTMFGLETDDGAQLQRHRLFETNWFCMAPPACQHGKQSIGVTGTGQALSGRRTIGVHGSPYMLLDRRRVVTVTGATNQQNVVRNQVRKTYSLAQAQQAMGIDWLPQARLSQAIPPAYTEFIGRQLYIYLQDCNKFVTKENP